MTDGEKTANAHSNESKDEGKQGILEYIGKRGEHIKTRTNHSHRPSRFAQRSVDGHRRMVARGHLLHALRARSHPHAKRVERWLVQRFSPLEYSEFTLKTLVGTYNILAIVVEQYIIGMMVGMHLVHDMPDAVYHHAVLKQGIHGEALSVVLLPDEVFLHIERCLLKTVMGRNNRFLLHTVFLNADVSHQSDYKYSNSNAQNRQSDTHSDGILRHHRIAKLDIIVFSIHRRGLTECSANIQK